MKDSKKFWVRKSQAYHQQTVNKISDKLVQFNPVLTSTTHPSTPSRTGTIIDEKIFKRQGFRQDEITDVVAPYGEGVIADGFTVLQGHFDAL